MAKIQAVGAHCTATLTEPDEDGDYGWTAPCGRTSMEARPVDEAIAHAEMHADDCEPVRAEICEHCNEPGGRVIIDPYRLELYDERHDMRLHERCEQSRIEDI